MSKEFLCTMKVVEKTSKKKEKKFSVLVLSIEGKEVEVGYYNAHVDNSLLRAGIDLRAE